MMIEKIKMSVTVDGKEVIFEFEKVNKELDEENVSRIMNKVAFALTSQFGVNKEAARGKRIAELYAEGKSDEEIREIIRKEL